MCRTSCKEKDKKRYVANDYNGKYCKMCYKNNNICKYHYYEESICISLCSYKDIFNE